MSAPIFLGTDLGNIGGGALVKYLVSRGWSLRRARGATISLSAAFILPAVMVGYLNDAYVAIALLIVAATAIASITANYLAALQDVSFANVGLIAGILGMFGNMVGATLQSADRTLRRRNRPLPSGLRAAGHSPDCRSSSPIDLRFG